MNSNQSGVRDRKLVQKRPRVHGRMLFEWLEDEVTA